ncbi:MAG: hypothetical protein NWE96_02130 [Candidatus Bathyarchaeota archaeon]|nr:hypothetical protein [Candidatus Bathyarchaeota archaeon]
MKPSTTILYTMVTLSLAFSIAAFVIVAQNNGVFAPSSPSSTTSPYPTMPSVTTPPITNTPTTTSPPPSSGLTLSYSESNREESNGKTKVTLTVTAEYHNGRGITESYSKFYLQLYAPRTTVYIYDGTTYPKNSGTFTVGP